MDAAILVLVFTRTLATRTAEEGAGELSVSPSLLVCCVIRVLLRQKRQMDLGYPSYDLRPVH